MQTRMQSVVESTMNILIGYLIALGTQIIVFPWYGMKVQLHQNIQIGIIFTIVSFIRSYCLRRFYNYRHRPKGV